MAASVLSVRVLAGRVLSLPDGSHDAGDELELPADEAKQLAEDGIIEVL